MKDEVQTWTRDDLRSALGEGFHAAFRKAVDGHGSAEMWRLIDAMPDRQWRNVLDFVLLCLPQERFIVATARKPRKQR
jgi:hypothetical protein